jgi:phospholipid/cholesterol/gamma-HCH transport system substrate-binding protein
VILRRVVKIQLVAFALLIVLGVIWVGANYVGISLPGHGPYYVDVMLSRTGGIYSNAVVSVRGVEVGKVASVSLAKSGTGHTLVDARLAINRGVHIPADNIKATVEDLSAVGEQYVDLEPATSGGPYLGSPGHTEIASSATSTPPNFDSELVHLNELLRSVNDKQLADVIKQLGIGFDNLGPILHSLIVNGDALTKDAIATLPQQLKLIDDGRTVLDTQNQVAGELKTFARTFAGFTQQVDNSDADLRGVLDNGIPAASVLTKLLNDNAPVLPTLLDNLITVNGIQAVRLPDVRLVLELYPATTSGGFVVTPGDGTAHFGQITDSQKPCKNGYSQPQRPNTPAGWGGTLDLNAYCHASATRDQRGARYDPKFAAGDHANITGSTSVATTGRERKLDCPVVYTSGLCGANKSGGSGSGSGSGSGGGGGGLPLPLPIGKIVPNSVITSTYDPKTGTVQGLDGKTYLLGYNGPLAPIFGSDSWQWLLLGPLLK